MIKKELGKISRVRYGFGGYQDAQFGITFSFSMNGSGIGDFWGFWGDEPGPGAKWTVKDQEKYFGNTAMRICKLMRQAKVQDINELKNIPVEITTERQSLKSWRVLEEVL